MSEGNGDNTPGLCNGKRGAEMVDVGEHGETAGIADVGERLVRGGTSVGEDGPTSEGMVPSHGLQYRISSVGESTSVGTGKSVGELDI